MPEITNHSDKLLAFGSAATGWSTLAPGGSGHVPDDVWQRPDVRASARLVEQPEAETNPDPGTVEPCERTPDHPAPKWPGMTTRQRERWLAKCSSPEVLTNLLACDPDHDRVLILARHRDLAGRDV